MGARNLAIDIVKKHLAELAEKAASEAAERAAFKATASPVQLVKLAKEDAHAAADLASERRTKGFKTLEEEQAAEQQWVEKRAQSNILRNEDSNKHWSDIRAKKLSEETATRPEPAARKDLDFHKYKLEKNIESVEEAARNPSKVAKARAAFEKENSAEKARRMEAGIVSDEGTKVISDSADEANAALDDNTKTKASAYAPALAIPAMKSGFTNPADVVKSGYDRLQKVRQSVVDKIVGLTDMTANNPHVPEYAKETYRKAAEALVSNATDPLNYVGGAGAADAVAGTAGAAYDIYSGNRKPSSTFVDANPVSNPTQVINWNK